MDEQALLEELTGYLNRIESSYVDDMSGIVAELVARDEIKQRILSLQSMQALVLYLKAVEFHHAFNKLDKRHKCETVHVNPPLPGSPSPLFGGQ